jgi:bifunctional non-homologous end joining protein LigD
VQPPRTSRFGSSLVAQPRELGTARTGRKFLTSTDDNLLRDVVYQGLREDKPAAEVRRAVPHPTPATTKRG